MERTWNEKRTAAETGQHGDRVYRPHVSQVRNEITAAKEKIIHVAYLL